VTQGFQQVWWIPGIPLIGFLIQALFGKAIVDALGKATGRRVMGAIAVLCVFIPFGITLGLLGQLGALPEHHKYAVETLFQWINVHPLVLPFEFVADPLSLVMCLVITGVGGLIHLYATGYMADEADYPRFFTYFNLFIVFMLTLVLGNNLALTFVGWEGVGLCSYLLIGFWYKEIPNAKAANKAFIVNRIGDWGFMLGIFLIFFVFGALSYYPSDVNGSRSILMEAPARLAHLGAGWADPRFWIPMLLLIGAMGKSAQGPLYLWLPDAMAGPTPVSALIHAATMVTAGVYMISRCHVFYELSPEAMLVVACVGAFTAFFAATVAFGQFDIKKVLAYSTVSQLGFMFLACGVGAFTAGMFHVVTHAFFKALLFLGSGAVIMAMAHEQDMRRYGNLRKFLPITYWTMFVGWLAIAGIPPLAGFWSKDEILARTFGTTVVADGTAKFLYAVGLITAFLTAGYMSRLMWMTFWQKDERWRKLSEHGNEHHGDEAEMDDGHHHTLGPHHEPHEVKISMWLPLAVLAALSAVGGLWLSGGHPLLSIGAPVFEHFTEPSVGTHLVPAPEMASSLLWTLAAVSVGAAALGIILAWRNYRKQPADQELGVPITGWRAWAGNQWGYDTLMYRIFVTGGGKFANFIWRWIDAGLIDKLLVNGVAKLIDAVGIALRPFQTGFVRGYAFTMLFGVVAIVGWIFYSAVNR